MLLHPDCTYEEDVMGTGSKCPARYHIIAKDEGDDTYATSLMNREWRPGKLYEHGAPNRDMVQDFGFISAARVKQLVGEFEAHVVWG